MELTYKKFENDLVSIGSNPADEALAARLFQFTRAANYINRNRVVNSYNAPFDMEATAEKMEIAIEKKSISELQGAEGKLLVNCETEKWVIQLSDDLLPGYPAEQFVFGHEVGHIFVFEYHAARGRAAINGYWARMREDPHFHPRVETFCDYFATKMVEWS